MKMMTILACCAMLMTPMFLSGQSIVGDWMMKVSAPDGTEVTNKVSFMADGKLLVDFMNDGMVDIEGTYTMDGNKISVNDTSTESPCYGKVGIYSATVEGDTVTMQLIEDPCDERRGDGQPGTMQRMK